MPAGFPDGTPGRRPDHAAITRDEDSAGAGADHLPQRPAPDPRRRPSAGRDGRSVKAGGGAGITGKVMPGRPAGHAAACPHQRHGRACPGHPRIFWRTAWTRAIPSSSAGWRRNKTWMAGTSPAMTERGGRNGAFELRESLLVRPSRVTDFRHPGASRGRSRTAQSGPELDRPAVMDSGFRPNDGDGVCAARCAGWGAW